MIKVCDLCKQPLKTIEWNTSVDISFCDNIHCDRWRNPIAVPKGSAKQYRQEVKATRKKTEPKPVGTTLKLQKLRNMITNNQFSII